MNIAVFTSNHPRHIAFLNTLARIPLANIRAVIECTPLYPKWGSEVKERYFARMQSAEHTLFGGHHFINREVEVFPVVMGDLERRPMEIVDLLREGRTASGYATMQQPDIALVFGASFIRGALLDYLKDLNAVNIHMGMSPYYRGADCNFWAMYDGNPQYVGATIHRLSEKLDGGDVLFTVRPPPHPDPWLYTMGAVMAAHEAVRDAIRSGLDHFPTVPQDSTLQIRYSRASDFTDEVVRQYLAKKGVIE